MQLYAQEVLLQEVVTNAYMKLHIIAYRHDLEDSINCKMMIQLLLKLGFMNGSNEHLWTK